MGLPTQFFENFESYFNAYNYIKHPGCVYNSMISSFIYKLFAFFVPRDFEKFGIDADGTQLLMVDAEGNFLSSFWKFFVKFFIKFLEFFCQNFGNFLSNFWKFFCQIFGNLLSKVSKFLVQILEIFVQNFLSKWKRKFGDWNWRWNLWIGEENGRLGRGNVFDAKWFWLGGGLKGWVPHFCQIFYFFFLIFGKFSNIFFQIFVKFFWFFFCFSIL